MERKLNIHDELPVQLAARLDFISDGVGFILRSVEKKLVFFLITPTSLTT